MKLGERLDEINKIVKFFKDKNIVIDELSLVSFEQEWSNILGGFSNSNLSIIGNKKYRQTTDIIRAGNYAFVFFKGVFAYGVSITNLFLNDIIHCSIVSKFNAKEKYKVIDGIENYIYPEEKE